MYFQLFKLIKLGLSPRRLFSMIFVFILLSSFFVFVPLGAQDAVEPNADAAAQAPADAVQEQQDAAPQDSSGVTSQTDGIGFEGSSDIMEFRSFRPVFDEMDFIDPEYDLRYFNKAKQAVERVKKELVSTRSAMKFQQESIDRTNTLRGFSYYRAFAPVFTNYYRYIMPAVRDQFYLLRSEKMLEDVGEVFNEKSAIFPLVVNDESELKNFVYDLKLLSAMVRIFRGSESDLKRAVADLEFLIGENEDKLSYVTSEDQKQDVYLFLVGVFDLLYKFNRDDYVISSDFLRKKLAYLWRTVSDRNASNEALKKVKLQILYDRYAPIMDPDSRDYQELYKPYRTEVLSGFKDLESQIDATTDEAPEAATDAVENGETPAAEVPADQAPAEPTDQPAQ